MANRIRLKRGTTVPLPENLVLGEIAVNTAEGVIYTKKADGEVVRFVGDTSKRIPLPLNSGWTVTTTGTGSSVTLPNPLERTITAATTAGGYAAVYMDTNGLIAGSSLANDFSKKWTFTGQVRVPTAPASTSSTRWRVYIGNGTANTFFGIIRTADGAINFFWNVLGTYTYHPTTFTPTTGVPFTFKIVHDGASTNTSVDYLYINDELMVTATNQLGGSSAGLMRIGGYAESTAAITSGSPANFTMSNLAVLFEQ